jgi:toxin CptA
VLWWTWQSAAPRWGQALAAVLVLLTGLAGLAAWRTSPAGAIAWDGEGWTLALGSGASVAGRLEAGPDLQWLLLARWRPQAGRARWLWLERRHAPQAWAALRRAVYSRARTEAPQGAQAASPPPVSAP